MTTAKLPVQRRCQIRPCLRHFHGGLWRRLTQCQVPWNSSMMITLRWLAFLTLTPPAVFITYWNAARLLNRLFHPLCPVGFWRTDILFGPNFCAYTPIFTLAESLCFFLTEVAVLLLIFVLPASHRMRVARVLLMLFVALPVLLAWWQGVGWLTLGQLATSLFLWLVLAVAYRVAPEHSLKREPVSGFARHRSP